MQWPLGAFISLLHRDPHGPCAACWQVADALASKLVQVALRRGTTDNVTCAVLFPALLAA